MKKIILMLCFLVSSSVFAQTLLLEENFNFAGNLTANGWTAHSGAGTQPIATTAGLTFANYYFSNIGNAAGVDNNGEDDNRTFVAQSSGIVYAAFLVNVTTISNGYFLHLDSNPFSTTIFRGKVFMQSNGANVQFGLSVGSNTPTLTPLSYSTGTTYLLVIKYEIVAGATNDKVSLYVFSAGDNFSTEPAATIGPLIDATQSDPVNIGSIALRQYSATQNVTVDGIRISTTWSDALAAPIATSATGVLATSFNANWNAINGVSGYYLDVATDAAFTSIVAGYNSLDVGNVTTKSVTGLTAGVTYYYRVRAYNSVGGAGPNSNVKANVEIVLAGIEALALAYTELDPATVITASTTVTSNLTNLDNAAVQITGNYQNGADVLAFTNALGITGSWDATTGKLTLTGTTTVANYQTALRSVTFQNTSLNPSTSLRTVSFTATGASINSNTVTRNISVTAINNAPVLAGIEVPNLTYTEGEAAKQITGTTTVSDVDNTTLSSATIQITTNYFNGQDVLSFTNQNGITGTWTAAIGTLGLSGASSVANYQTAIRSVLYQNTSQNPNTSVRTVSFTVNDGALNSNILTRNINVVSVNNPPVISSLETAPLNYPTGSPAVAITQTISLSDPDNVNLASAEVKIVGHYQNGNDVLSFTNALGITGTWDASTGTMTLTGVSLTANYQTALRSVTYQHTEGAIPDLYQRTISIKANDGAADSYVFYRDVNLGNTPPSLAGVESIPLEYKQGDNPKTITNGISITDNGIPNIANASVKISNNYKNGEDVLSFTNQNGIIGTWNPSLGELDLNLSSSLSNYETALRSITYNNISNNPSALLRTVSFKVTDVYAESNEVTRTINITPVYTVALITAPTNGGTISGAGTFDPGTSVTVTATPNTGFSFVNWTDGGTIVSTNASYTFTINSSRTLTANFAIIQCIVTLSSSPTEGGTTSGAGTFNYGSSVSVTATPSSGYSFVNWTSGSTVISSSSTYTFTITSVQNLVANFMMLPILTVTPDFLSVGPVAGTASIDVSNTGGGVMNWGAVSDIFWIKITSGASGTNNGIINISYNHNNSVPRVGTVTITAEGVTGSPKSIEIRQGAAITYVESLNLGIPDDYRIEQNYPNPFNPTTRIRYGLPKDGNVVITVYNVLGEEVAKLMNDFQSAGYYEINFDASNLTSGIYIYRISAGSFTQTRKMLLIK